MNRTISKRITLAAAFLLSVGMASSASALPLTFTASGTNPNSGQALAASVTFSVSGTNLIVTLTNTSTADVLVPTDVLTGVFFTVTGATLTPVSALLGMGSTVLFGPNGGGNVGGEWAYAGNLMGAPGGATSGNSSSGLGLFGGPNFGGVNLQDPVALDGLQYGITSAGDNSATGNTPVTGTNALIQNSVVFTLAGLPANFDPSTSISTVSFQYGTALTEPNITGYSTVPEPGSMLLLASGLAGLGFLRRRMRAA